MRKIEYFLENYTGSAICFLMCFIFVIPLVIFVFEYSIEKTICESELVDINNIEGYIENKEEIKTNTYFTINNSDKRFVIHTDNIETYNIKIGDHVVIHYADRVPIRNEQYEIVNLKHNNITIYSLEQFKQTHDPHNYIYLIISFSGIMLFIITLGIILIYKDKPVKNVRIFVEMNKEKYGLTDEQAEEVINQFEFPKEPEEEIEIPIEDLHILFEDSVYSKNNKLYTYGLEYIQNEECGDIFFEVLSNTVNEKELKVIYDDCVKNDAAIYLIYQINNKKAVINLFKDHKTNLFHVNANTLFFINTKKSEPTKAENIMFIKEIIKYNQFEETIFFIEEKIN